MEEFEDSMDILVLVHEKNYLTQSNGDDTKKEKKRDRLA